MVQGLDSHDLSRLYQSAGDLHVFLTGCRITTGMIVNEENPGCRFLNGGPKDLSGMYQGGREGSLRYPYDSQDTVFAIQQHTPEAFLLQAMDKRLEMAKDLKAGAKGLSWKQGYFLKAA